MSIMTKKSNKIMLPKEFTEVPWSMDQEWKKCNKDTRTSFLKVFSYL